MATFFLLMLILIWPIDIAHAGVYELKKRAGGFEVEARIDRNPLVLGDHKIEIEIKDSEGKEVTNADVWVFYYMPPMPRMAPMNYKTEAKVKKGKYRAKMKFIMSGPWIISIKIDTKGQVATAKFNVDVQ